MKKLLTDKRLLMAAVFSMLLISVAVVPEAGGLTPEQQRGRQIYTTGVAPDGDKIIAVMSGVNVPASVMPCVSCHGEHGKGNPEGGIVPSNLTWGSLGRAYTGEGHNGRSHPAYTEKSLVKSISMGLDPAGNELQKAMPRYQMSQQSMADLIAYLKVIGNQSNLGIREDELRVGMLLSANPQKGEALFRVLQAFFNGLNQAGGLYGRSISLFGITPDPAHPAASLRKFVEEKEIFAFCGSALDKNEAEILQFLNSEGIPLVGAISGEDPNSFLKNQQVFFLCAGPLLQSRALFDLAADSLELKTGETAILHGNTGVESLIQLARKAGLGKVVPLAWDAKDGAMPKKDLQKLRSDGIKAIFLAGLPDEAISALMKHLEESAWYPYLLVTGEQAAPAFLDAPAGIAGKVMIAYPTWLSVISPKMKESFEQFASENDLSPDFRQSQYAVLAAGILMSEALRASGRDLSRGQLKAELEKVQALQTGLLPPLTYGVNRRTGSMRVFVVTPDKGNLRLLQERSK